LFLKLIQYFILLILTIQFIIEALVDQCKTYLCRRDIVGNLAHPQITRRFIRQYYKYPYFDYSIA